MRQKKPREVSFHRQMGSGPAWWFTVSREKLRAKHFFAEEGAGANSFSVCHVGIEHDGLEVALTIYGRVNFLMTRFVLGMIFVAKEVQLK